MKIIQLIHDKQLNYPMARDLPLLAWDTGSLPGSTDGSPSSFPGSVGDSPAIISFRQNPAHPPSMIKKNMHACHRLLDLPLSDNVVLIGLETDSPLAPLILWDLVHLLPLNATITLLDAYSKKSSYLQRSYFSDSLQVVSQTDRQLVLRKVAPLLVEKDRGLDRWSFGIPVGPEDATGLNAVVKRILELDMPEKEIILCGRPGENFKYWDQVRIVGEDIPAPPVRICRKKNVIAEAARFENLCILHDRVFLPKNFYQGMLQFGDFFPFMALQSIFFTDKHNFVPHRYSDYNLTINKPTSVYGLDRKGDLNQIFPAGLADYQKNGFICANPCRYQETTCATGSLYICKKNLWAYVPQDESLIWSEFEDIEHGLRASATGIPSRVNPYIFIQSLYARPLLLGESNSVFYESKQGRILNSKSPGEGFIAEKKPLFKVSLEVANKKLQEFIARYVSHVDQSAIILMVAKMPVNPQTWIMQAGAALALAKLDRTQEAVTQFLNDLEKMVFFDEVPHVTRHYLLQDFKEHGTPAKLGLYERYWLWTLLLIVSPKSKIFYNTLQDFFVANRKKTKIGSFVAACWLNRHNKNLFYHPDGLKGYYQAILNSTPFVDYLHVDFQKVKT